MARAHTPQLRKIIRMFQKAIFETTDFYSKNTISGKGALYDPDRRRFTKEMLAAGIGAALIPGIALSSCDTSNNNTGEDLKVAIIGGGMAGLRCGYGLKKDKIAFTIYEADSRTGGRVMTKQAIFGEGLWTEFGGEFIDSDHYDMLELIEEFKLNKIDTYTDSAIREVVYINGTFYNEEDVMRQFNRVAPHIAQDLQYCGPDFDTKEAKVLDNLNLEEYIRSFDCEIWFQEMLLAAYIGEYGLDATEQSSLNLIDLISTDVTMGFKIFGNSDERYKVEGGNQKIVDALADEVKDYIHLNHRLTKIAFDGGRYALTFNNEKVEYADKVVMTIPFTILRTIDMTGIEMDAMKKRCIEELGYGQNSKIMMGFDKRVWREEEPSKAGFLTNENIHTGWDNSQMQQNSEGPAGYTVFVGGERSIELAQAAKESNLKSEVPQEYVDKYLNILNEVFPGMKETYTNNHKAALWPNNPYSLGSYACCKPGQYTSLVSYASIPVGNLYFAGEHCSEEFLGYMNGAAQTGRVAAETIKASIAANSD